MTTHCAPGRLAARFRLAALLCAVASPLHAQSLIWPSFQGSSGSSGMTAGVQAMMFSAPQTGAAISYAGAQELHAGFFGFMSGFTDSATSVAGQPTIITLMTPVGLATITLPADCVPPGTLVTASLTPAPPSADGEPLAAVPLSAITIHSIFQPTAPVTLDIAYNLADLSGLDPGRFTLASFDTTLNAWVALGSTVDPSSKVVVAQATHFSIFQLMRPASGAASTAKVFPNPMRPSLGETAMTFARLPANARIRVYTVKGAVIKELSADPTGAASWDGTNRSGVAAASGVYFALVQGSGRSFTLTVAIER